MKHCRRTRQMRARNRLRTLVLLENRSSALEFVSVLPRVPPDKSYPPPTCLLNDRMSNSYYYPGLSAFTEDAPEARPASSPSLHISLFGAWSRWLVVVRVPWLRDKSCGLCAVSAF